MSNVVTQYGHIARKKRSHNSNDNAFPNSLSFRFISLIPAYKADHRVAVNHTFTQAIKRSRRLVMDCAKDVNISAIAQRGQREGAAVLKKTNDWICLCAADLLELIL